MSKETADNAMARGPPLGRWASVPAGGRHIRPQCTIPAWPQTLRADPGPYRIGPFSLLRTGRNFQITTETKGN